MMPATIARLRIRAARVASREATTEEPLGSSAA
jgi:hypothetical protein